MLTHKRLGHSRIKILLLVFGGFLVLVLAIGVVESLSYAKLLKEGAVDTLDSLNFNNKFSSDKKLAGSTNTSVDVSSVDSPAIGSDKAILRAVEFVDFSCPYSKEESIIIRDLVASNPDLVRLEVRNFPLDDIHPYARRAALAAACANEQGKYWAMHDSLYANQKTDGIWLDPDLRRIALGVGLDGKKYDLCMKDSVVAGKVQTDVDAGLKAGVVGTPTFFVNGYKIDGAIPADIWQKIINLVK